MIDKVFSIFLLTSLLVFITACGSSNNQTSDESTKQSTGRSLYISKCTSCHKAYDRELHTPDEWEKILNEMGKKAKLRADEKENILKYLSERNLN
ncbi:MAG TPA: hypothetical protein DHV28_06320 [Ignavibacteriales bacterium]|nr:hypothetical protein [Ignavibacteriales bacterium]